MSNEQIEKILIEYGEDIKKEEKKEKKDEKKKNENKNLKKAQEEEQKEEKNEEEKEKEIKGEKKEEEKKNKLDNEKGIIEIDNKDNKITLGEKMENIEPSKEKIDSKIEESIINKNDKLQNSLLAFELKKLKEEFEAQKRSLRLLNQTLTKTRSRRMM